MAENVIFGETSANLFSKHNISKDTPHFLYSGSLIYTLWLFGNESVNALLKTP